MREPRQKKALIIGATGLVGKQLLSLLLEDDRYEKVIAIGRRMSDVKHPKLHEVVTSFDRLDTVSFDYSIDDAFCCLGTTMKKAKHKEAFYKVDFTYVQYFAEVAQRHQVRTFSVVSASMAKKNSVFYYNRVKGMMEDMLKGIKFDRLVILRPSLLLGDREEVRLGEDLGKFLVGILGFMLPDRFKGIRVEQVAQAMFFAVNTLSSKTSHVEVLESEKIKLLASAMNTEEVLD
ncbi:NAD-dependent epimerase/dehydratase family protein [Algivirga pacifica]|uniref:Oxidoreductase n=1 Tax=Algivirga pacifica TaxID=1162670 RepID=A0ABP9DHH6_9BACT